MCIIGQNFTFLHKINTKVSTHDRIVCLYSINICYFIFVSYEFVNFYLIEYVQLQGCQNILHR